MNFQLVLLDLQTAIGTIQRASNSNSTMSALEAIHFRFNQDHLILTCHNLAIGISATIPLLMMSQVDDNCEFLVNCKLLSEIVRKMSGENIDFELKLSTISNEVEKIKVASGKSVFEISAVSKEGFAPLTRIEAESSIVLGQNQLKELIKRTSFCAGTIDNKPVLTGCYLERVKNDQVNEISMVALDGSRLAKRVITLETQDIELAVVIPSRSLNELIRIIRDTDDPVEIRISRNGAEFLFDNILFSSRIFNFPYVEYRKITSQSCFERSILINTKQFLSSVDRVSILLSSETNKKPIILNIKNKKIEITCDTSIGSSRDEVAIESELDFELQIAFNHKFLIEALKNVSSEKCMLKFGNSTSPALIEPPDSQDFVFVILPVRIR